MICMIISITNFKHHVWKLLCIWNKITVIPQMLSLKACKPFTIISTWKVWRMGLCFATDHADQYLVQNSAEFRVLKSALEFLNLDSNKFTSNSVRIKAATKATTGLFRFSNKSNGKMSFRVIIEIHQCPYFQHCGFYVTLMLYMYDICHIGSSDNG